MFNAENVLNGEFLSYMGSLERKQWIGDSQKESDSSPEPLTITHTQTHTHTHTHTHTETHTNKYILIHQSAQYIVKPLLRRDSLD